MMTETLGRFGHHPDPACDFCVEVEVIEGMDYDVGVGAGDRAALRERISRAMEFVVGGDEIAVKAKAILRTIDEKYRTPKGTLSDTDTLVRRIGDALLARVNAPEQEIYRAVRDGIEAALSGENDG